MITITTSKKAQAAKIKADTEEFLANGGKIYYAKENESGIGKKPKTKRSNKELFEKEGTDEKDV